MLFLEKLQLLLMALLLLGRLLGRRIPPTVAHAPWPISLVLLLLFGDLLLMLAVVINLLRVSRSLLRLMVVLVQWPKASAITLGYFRWRM